jgi:small subunit ribosomal protein S8e
MTIYQVNLKKRKRTGGKRTPSRRRREYEMGRGPTETKISEGEEVVEERRVFGANVKLRVRATGNINVSSRDGKTTRAKILALAENPSNPLYSRRGIITKGAIVKTTVGMVKVTSKPGRDGTLNGTLLEETAAA